MAWYDNSRNNPHNPDPNATVTWGDQTYQEMMVGFFDVAVPANMDKEQFFMRGQGGPRSKHPGSRSSGRLSSCYVVTSEQTQQTLSTLAIQTHMARV